MSTNVENAKKHLKTALGLLPASKELNDLIVFIKKAISEAEKIELKDKKNRHRVSASVADIWTNKIKEVALNSQNPYGSLQVLDKMIEEEQNKLKKLESIKDSQVQNNNTTTLID